VQTPGTYISAIGHAGLIAWLIAGWGLSAEPLPFEVSEVSVVTGEEYAQLVAASTPQPSTAEPDAPVVPVFEEPPSVPEVTEDTVTPTEPVVVEPPAEDTPPPDAPQPIESPTEVEITPPDVAPPALEETPAIPDPITDAPPQARPAPRVTPDPVPAPEPDIQVDAPPEPTLTPEPSEDPAEVEPIEPAAAPDTTTEIVTEPEEPSGAVETSLRPAVRPNRPASQPAAEPETPPTEDPAVAAALAEALNAPDVPQGPPMTGSERDAFRVAVNRCWNVDPGSVAARVTMTVGFSLTQEGRVDGNVRQIAASGGDDGAVRTAFEAARRAILRCQNPNGYDLPADKYGQWKDVEITFDPSGMRLR